MFYKVANNPENNRRQWKAAPPSDSEPADDFDGGMLKFTYSGNFPLDLMLCFKRIFQLFSTSKKKLMLSSFGDTYAVSNHIAFISLTEKQLQGIWTDVTQTLRESDSGVRTKLTLMENSKTEWFIFRKQWVCKKKKLNLGVYIDRVLQETFSCTASISLYKYSQNGVGSEIATLWAQLRIDRCWFDTENRFLKMTCFSMGWDICERDKHHLF